MCIFLTALVSELPFQCYVNVMCYLFGIIAEHCGFPENLSGIDSLLHAQILTVQVNLPCGQECFPVPSGGCSLLLKHA